MFKLKASLPCIVFCDPYVVSDFFFLIKRNLSSFLSANISRRIEWIMMDSRQLLLAWRHLLFQYNRPEKGTQCWNGSMRTSLIGRACVFLIRDLTAGTPDWGAKGPNDISSQQWSFLRISGRPCRSGHKAVNGLWPTLLRMFFLAYYVYA
jgi:hypothetical protein